MPGVQTKRIVVIGIGNPFRRDDGVGIAVARQLKKILPETVKVIEQNGEASDLMEAWKGAESVIVIDAVSSGAKPGTIHRLSFKDESRFKIRSQGSTHSFGLTEAIALSRHLNYLPEEGFVFGIEGVDYAQGSGFSPDVLSSVGLVVEQIGDLLQSGRIDPS